MREFNTTTVGDILRDNKGNGWEVSPSSLGHVPYRKMSFGGDSWSLVGMGNGCQKVGIRTGFSPC